MVGQENPIDLIEEVEGEKYFTVKSFARIICRSEQSVRFLISRGNRIRKLKAVKKLEKPLIPVSELVEFPFTMPGRGSKTVYHYNMKGQQE